MRKFTGRISGITYLPPNSPTNNTISTGIRPKSTHITRHSAISSSARRIVSRNRTWSHLPSSQASLAAAIVAHTGTEKQQPVLQDGSSSGLQQARPSLIHRDREAEAVSRHGL